MILNIIIDKLSMKIGNNFCYKMITKQLSSREASDSFVLYKVLHILVLMNVKDYISEE